MKSPAQIAQTVMGLLNKPLSTEIILRDYHEQGKTRYILNGVPCAPKYLCNAKAGDVLTIIRRRHPAHFKMCDSGLWCRTSCTLLPKNIRLRVAHHLSEEPDVSFQRTFDRALKLIPKY